MPFLRSDDMIRCQVLLNQQSVFSWTREIIKKEICQIVDMHPTRNILVRPYINELRQLNEIERQLIYFEKMMQKAEIKPLRLSSTNIAVNYRTIEALSNEFVVLEETLVQISTKIDQLEKAMKQLKELHYVLDYASEFFSHRDSHLREAQKHTLADSGLIYASGILPLSKILSFNRLVHIISKGNLFIRYFNIPMPVQEPNEVFKVYKSVFLIICHGEKMLDKLLKIAAGYRATIYEIPERNDEREAMISGVTDRINEIESILDISYQKLKVELEYCKENFVMWTLLHCELMHISKTISLYYLEGSTYTTDFFIPVANISIYLSLYKIVSDECGVEQSIVAITIPKKSSYLPTYTVIDKFTSGFQAIIDAYGIATYKELNPTIYSLISFPFLFSVMFGDFGHGILLLFFGLFLVLKEKYLQKYVCENEIFEIIFGGRYIILMMALFSLYSGLIYNDCFSKPFCFLDSAWNVNEDNFPQKHYERGNLILDPSDILTYEGEPYFLGLDPAWTLSKNKITLHNSYKKKISVIFGVLQMTLGVFVKLCNDIYFKNKTNIIFEFIPMILFLWLLFGYLCLLIFLKWTFYYSVSIQGGSYVPDAPDFYQCSPNLLIGFINMFIQKKPTPSSHCSSHMWIPSQDMFETIFLLVAIISVFVMLLAKPFYLKSKYNRYKTKVEPERHMGDGDTGTAIEMRIIVPKQLHEYYTHELRQLIVPYPEDEVFNFGELFVHQVIHTIEYCLGCVSHTASYLRLWALSLAHQQLSEVLWTMVLHAGLTFNITSIQFIAIFVAFTPFALLTIAILLVMEGLSAFLHTLRLHWVEFNSKFYQGAGIIFQPLSFKDCVKKICKYQK